MTAKEIRQIAELTAQFLHELQDRMIPLAEVATLYGWSESWLYKNRDRLGGVKAGARIFFSKNNLDRLIKTESIGLPEK